MSRTEEEHLTFVLISHSEEQRIHGICRKEKPKRILGSKVLASGVVKNWNSLPPVQSGKTA